MTSGKPHYQADPVQGVVWWLGPDLVVWHRVSDCAPLPMWHQQDRCSCYSSKTTATAWDRAQVLR